MAVLPQSPGFENTTGKTNQVKTIHHATKAMVTQILLLPFDRREVCCWAKSFATMLQCKQQNLLSTFGRNRI